MCPASPQPSYTIKPPQTILSGQVPGEEILATAREAGSASTGFTINKIFAFPPNRDTLGGTSYLIVRNEGNILIDCPALEQINQDFWECIPQNNLQQTGVRWLFITHRGAIGQVAEVQQALDCEILIQEQEAYLLPGLNVTTFAQEFTLDATTQVIWTPGHSPGSSCLYYREFGGVLFSGRHLLPNLQGEPVPLRTPKTFHWPRQIKSVQALRDRFTPETLQYICPGANIGFLRGKRIIDNAYQRLVIDN
ncbi:MBL fold metallo-hydrolase [Sphaerospermopsis aphanizomenoides BCCUSP55]|uniref:MBL fold metallo-hydrolase n=1 Tax=Sphaerospermopsis aphanizomenoides TaxID=459663 RepID=UPI000AB619D9|nr:MBL fold metallo-hydrolase [Sphaerospermopsis aphanizomenoides]MBK1990347.1 MBL fold metallo-hydrolase [Sphaerospermopsis aphanizomenoides BCCUSP55]